MLINLHTNNIGYYKERLNILKITLDFLLTNTNKNLYDLIVLNNSNYAKSTSLLKNYYNQKKLIYLLMQMKTSG